MWHRRGDGGTGSGTTLGMTFVSDTVLQTVSDSDASLPDIQFYDLIELVVCYPPKCRTTYESWKGFP